MFDELKKFFKETTDFKSLKILQKNKKYFKEIKSLKAKQRRI